MILKVLFAVCFIASIVLTPLYLEAQKNKGLKSLTLKMLDSTCFLSAGILAAFITDNHSEFSKYIIIALAMSWVGDFLLHVIKPKFLNGIGFVSFMVAHVFYIIAYNTAAQSIEPGRAFLQPWGYAIPVLCITVYAIFIIKKMQFVKLGIFASIAYGIVILIMFAKAADLAVLGLQTGITNAAITAVLLLIGAALFVASDFTISFLIFDKRFKKNYPLKIFNIATYFAGQLLLASLILTVR